MSTSALVVDVNRTKILKILSAHSLYTSSMVCHPYFIWPELFIQFFTISLFKLLAPWKCIVHFWVVFINPNRIISIIFPKNTAHRWYEFTPVCITKRFAFLYKLHTIFYWMCYECKLGWFFFLVAQNIRKIYRLQENKAFCVWFYRNMRGLKVLWVVYIIAKCNLFLVWCVIKQSQRILFCFNIICTNDKEMNK